MADSTRDRILEAATYLAQTSGIETLSMEAAADAAGVSRKTVYNYFDNKHSLADEVADLWMSQMLEALAGITSDSSMDCISKINTILSYSFERMNLASRMWRTHSKLQVDRRVTEMKIALRRKLRHFIQQIVLEANYAGLLQPEFETDRLAWIFINIIEGVLVIDEFEDVPFNKADLLKDSLRAVIRGMLSNKGAAALQASPIFHAGLAPVATSQGVDNA